MTNTVLLVVFVFILAVVFIKRRKALLFDYNYANFRYADSALALSAAHLRIRIKREFRKLNLSENTVLRFQDAVHLTPSTTTCTIARDLGFGEEYSAALKKASPLLEYTTFEPMLGRSLPNKYTWLVDAAAMRLRRDLANDLVEMTLLKSN